MEAENSVMKQPIASSQVLGPSCIKLNGIGFFPSLVSPSLILTFLFLGVAFLKSEAYFNETAELPCQFSNSQNLSLNELVIFWQDQKKFVLYEFYLAKENLNNVDPKYMHRTSFDQSNWTLRLHRAQIKDKGIYQCIIHHKRPTGLVSLHQKDSELSVFANFTEPEIVQMSNETGNSGINLTCSSGQGYPKAVRMYFLLKLENSTELEYDGAMQTSQDNDTELYNVSISSYVPFSEGMSNVTIFCVLKTKSVKSRERELLSKPFCRDSSLVAKFTLSFQIQISTIPALGKGRQPIQAFGQSFSADCHFEVASSESAAFWSSLAEPRLGFSSGFRGSIGLSS
ncbi:T-lymphocyte activation antigen CD86 [Erethizon dorsatum]